MINIKRIQQVTKSQLANVTATYEQIKKQLSLDQEKAGSEFDEKLFRQRQLEELQNSIKERARQKQIAEDEKRKKAEVRAQKFMESASLMANAIQTEKKTRTRKKKGKTQQAQKHEKKAVGI